MGYLSVHSGPVGRPWAIADEQHGVVTHRQLVAIGLHPQAIKHRIASGRLHPIRRGVYAVGRPELSRHGHWLAAVLSCGPGAVLSHWSAAALWELLPERDACIHISAPAQSNPRPPGIAIHRRKALLPPDLGRRDGIPLTSPARTLIDLASVINRERLERAINEADKLDLIDPASLRAAVDARRGQRGVGVLRDVLDRRTFVLTDSQLERRFLPLARGAGLPKPRTGQRVNGFKVDFYWPDLGLVVETDGLRYHRTPVQQARDRLRDQTHTAAGLTCLRFTHSQVTYEPEHVLATLRRVYRRQLNAAE